MIIAVGSEILRGKITDTNSGRISAWLTRRGIEVTAHFSAPDSPEALGKLMPQASQWGDILLFTGGLGPTQDDLTLEAVASGLDRPLVFNRQMWENIKKSFCPSGGKISETNRKLALLPKGGVFLPNRRGSAPGVVIEEAGRVYILLPGPPREAIPLLDEEVEALLERRFPLVRRRERIWRVYNTGESRLQEILSGGNFQGEIGIYFKQEGWIELHFTPPREGEPEKIRKALEARGLLVTEDRALSLLVMEELQKRGLTLGFAESLTAGQLTAEIVQHPGASAVLLGGVAAYSNRVKEEVLGVEAATLSSQGAVSQGTVEEMARGLKNLLKPDCVVAVSGIAGPRRGNRRKASGNCILRLLYPRGNHGPEKAIQRR